MNDSAYEVASNFFERQTRTAAADVVHSSHSSFSRRSFFGSSAHAATRMRWNGRIFWLLAFCIAPSRDASFFPPSPPGNRLTIGSWEVVSSYSSATAPESHGNSSRRSTDQPLQRTAARSSGLRLLAQDLFNRSVHAFIRLIVQFSRHRRSGLRRFQFDAGPTGKISGRALDGGRRFSLRRFQKSCWLSWRFRGAKSRRA